MKLVVLRGGPCGEALAHQSARLEPTATGRRGAVALSDDGGQWILLNVAPNVAQQLQGDARLACHSGLRDADVRTVVLTDAQVDHVSGLLSLRDGAPIDLYATPAVFEVLSQNLPVLQVLQHYCGVHWHVIPVAGETLSASFRINGLPDLEFTALASEGVASPHLQGLECPMVTGLSIALAVLDVRSGQRLFFAPGALSLGEGELDWLRSADCVLLDDHTTWPQTSTPTDSAWRARRKVMFSGQPSDRPSGHHANFEAAYDGMVIEL